MNLNNLENKKRYLNIGIWALLHIALIVAVVLSYPWKIDRNLYSIVPESETSPEIHTAETVLAARTSSRIMLFVGDSDFTVAKTAAEKIGHTLLSSKQIESASWTVDPSSMKEISDYLFAERFALQDPSILQMDDSAAADYFYSKALSRIYGAFPTSDLSRLEEDPYLLSQNAQDRVLLGSPLTMSQMTLRDDYLVVEDSGRTYVFIQAKISMETSAFASEDHILGVLEDKIEALQKEYPGLRIEKSGVPFHSYSSSEQAQVEVAWISGISTVAVLLLLLLVFRSALPIVTTLASIGVAILAAIGATLATFHEIHIFTFIFGTSVIGVSIDYALHHFADREAQVKSMLLGFMTTELSYIALVIVDFPILRQMAFFSMVGLASALLSVLLVFPFVSEKMEGQGNFPLKIAQLALTGYSKLERIPKVARYIIFVVAAAALIPGFVKLSVQTDIRSMYTVAPELGASEMKVSQWMNMGIAPTYFIVSGDSEDDVLKKEEALTEKLRAAEKDSLLKSHLALSDILPSKDRRSRLNELLSKSLPIKYKELCKQLKMKPVKNAQKKLLTADESELNSGLESLPGQLQSMREMLWIGNVSGKYYSAVLPQHVSKDFNPKQYADPENGVYAVNKIDEVNGALTELSLTALSLVAFAYFAVFFILSFVYTWRDSLRVVRAPVLACVFTLSMFGYMEIPVNFFAITGLILVLGIGIDYALFFKDSRNHTDSTAFAVMLSAATTLISFGTLSFSGFAPVSVLGLSVLLGISVCFLLSPFTRD
ncbi:MAG: MMPL family transporter [Fibrobacter sp.]|nr:MMPL family transporter [Fibrobacter sp.]